MRRPRRAEVADRLGITPDAVTLTTVNTLIAAKDATIARLDAEVAFLREQLDHSRRELSSERERFDVIHREALQRIEALTAGPVAEDTGHDAADEPSDRPGREQAAHGVETRSMRDRGCPWRGASSPGGRDDG